jgi:hypothetical protein
MENQKQMMLRCIVNSNEFTNLLQESKRNSTAINYYQNTIIRLNQQLSQIAYSSRDAIMSNKREEGKEQIKLKAQLDNLKGG